MTQQEKFEQIVINQYLNPSDSLKKKAALFLLDNIKNKFHHSGDNYNRFIGFFNKHSHNRDSFVIGSEDFKGIEFELTNDIEKITPNDFINNIEKAFIALDRAEFKNKIDFNTFCEYVLPYRINNEVFEHWRDSALSDVPDSIFENRELDIACEELTKTMVKNKKDFLLRFGNNALNIPDLPYTKQRKLLAGSCDNVAPYSMFLARAAGLPVAQDFTPNYANRSAGHTWCALILNNKNSIPFNVPNSDKMGQYTVDDFIVSKVYRRTYSDNSESHFFQRGYCNFLPTFMNSKNLIDVTDQYHKTSGINVPVYDLSENDEFGYLCVFDNKNWQVVDWGKIKEGLLTFDKVPQGVVFLPVFMEPSKQKPANYPFLIGKNNQVEYIKPNYERRSSIVVKRKYWLSNRINFYMERMIGGKFEASNSPDFKDAITLFKITENPGGKYNEFFLTENRKFRYYRYISPKDGYGNIAEFQLYEKENDKSVKGRIIGTKGSWENNLKTTRESAFDGEALTFFDSPWPDESWVGMDFGKPINIQKIKFLARNDDNNVLVGGEYELFFWDNEWKSHSREKAVSDSITFENVPSNALYLLHYFGDGTEERIFTFKNGEQIWW